MKHFLRIFSVNDDSSLKKTILVLNVLGTYYSSPLTCVSPKCTAWVLTSSANNKCIIIIIIIIIKKGQQCKAGRE